jgi:predicted DNA-binding transcriptional regulator YafY
MTPLIESFKNNFWIFLKPVSAMKKTERLNDLLIYLNGKKYFNLKEIMQKYSISKSTALRDIQSLEAIGMPIYATSGRYGRYGILPNRLLSPIFFTEDEVRALYFAMQTLGAYQSTPFDLSIEALKQKFERCIAEEALDKIHKMEVVFSFDSPDNGNKCMEMGNLLEMAIEERVCQIDYRKGTAHAQTFKTYYVQFFEISAAYGQWYAIAYNFETAQPQVFRCDRILSVKACSAYAPKSLREFSKPAEALFRQDSAIDFEVIVSEKGADLFRKEHYPSMHLSDKHGQYLISGYYNQGEASFIAQYFSGFGETVLSVQPQSLKALILTRIETLRRHFNTL